MAALAGGLCPPAAGRARQRSWLHHNLLMGHFLRTPVELLGFSFLPCGIRLTSLCICF